MGFLGRHEEWSAHPALFPKVRREADEVFQDQPGSLSVEATRARELECEVEPLLPFPTTSNMETLDDFASYPEGEWAPGAQPAPRERTTTPAPAPAPAPAPSPAPAAPESTTTSPGVSAVAGRAISVPVKTRQRGIKRVREENETPSETDSDESSDDNDENEEDAKSAPQPAAKRPRVTLNVSPRPRPTIKLPSTKKAAAPRQPSPTIKLSSTKKAPKKAPSTNKASTSHDNGDLDSRANAKAMKDSTDRLARISRGEIVPESQIEARQAQALRKQRLLSSKKNSKRPVGSTPDLMPEFFEKANFTDTEADEGPIRCVCGAVSDDLRSGEEWVGCSGDECGGCWQHVKCLGDAVSSSKAERESEDYEYFCHLCDPYRHRKTLQKIRRGETIVH